MYPSHVLREGKCHAKQIAFRAAYQDHFRARGMSGSELRIISSQNVYWLPQPIEKP
jgi:hypothetical protein